MQVAVANCFRKIIEVEHNEAAVSRVDYTRGWIVLLHTFMLIIDARVVD